MPVVSPQMPPLGKASSLHKIRDGVRVSLAWVEEQERQYRDTQRQLLALLERRWELADELAQAQRQLEQLQRREALPDDDN